MTPSRRIAFTILLCVVAAVTALAAIPAQASDFAFSGWQMGDAGGVVNLPAPLPTLYDPSVFDHMPARTGSWYPCPSVTQINWYTSSDCAAYVQAYYKYFRTSLYVSGAMAGQTIYVRADGHIDDVVNVVVNGTDTGRYLYGHAPAASAQADITPHVNFGGLNEILFRFADTAAVNRGITQVSFRTGSDAAADYDPTVGTWPPIAQLAAGTPTGVGVSGGYAYVAAQSAMTVIDVSTPSQPRQVAYCDTFGDAHDIAVAAGYAYIADGEAGLAVVDLSDPAHPLQVGHCGTPRWAYGVAFSDNFAYLADYWDGSLRVIDVSDPANPVEVGHCETPDLTCDVTVANGYAYVANAGSVRVIDVHDPANPVEVGYWNSHDWAGDVAVSDSYAYVADRRGQLRVLDVSDPTHPVEVGYSDTRGWAASVVLEGTRAYVTDGNGLQLLDLSDPTHPVEVGYVATPGSANAAVVSGSYAYVADSWGGLRVVDVSNPANSVEVGCEDTLGRAPGLSVSGGYVYLASDVPGLRVLDVSNPAIPAQVARTSWDPEWAKDVVIRSGYAYVAVYGIGLVVMDVSDPTHPVQVGACYAPQYDMPPHIAVAGSYAYLATRNDVVQPGTGSLWVVDVSDPAHPVEVGRWVAPTRAWDVAVWGGYAYVTPTLGTDLWVVDVSDPANPIQVGSWTAPGYISGVTASGGYVYVGGEGGVHVLDISNPASPVEVAHWSTPGAASRVALAAGYAYVADWYAGLRILDISDPAHPVEVAYWDTPGSPSGVVVSDGYVYLADNLWGLLVFPEYRKVVSASHMSACPGSTIRVPISLNAAEGVAAAQIDLRYDATILTALSVEKGGLVGGDSHWQLYSQISAGRTQALLYNDEATALGRGGGALVNIVFQVNPLAAPGSSTVLELRKAILADAMGNALSSQGQDGSVTVIPVHHFVFDSIVSPQGGDLTHPLPFEVRVEARDASNALVSTYNGTADLTSSVGTAAPATIAFTNGVGQVEVTILADLDPDCTLTVTDASVPASGTSNVFALRGKGDPTSDGAVNVLDVMRTVNIVLSNPIPQPPRYEFQYWAADMNDDGAVNVQDIILIINKIFDVTPLSQGKLMAMAAAAQPSGQPVVVGASWGTSASGNPVLAITLDNAAGVAGAQIDVAYNAKRVRDVVARGGGLIAAASDWNVFANKLGGVVRVLAFSGSAQALAGGAGAVVELEFLATGKGNLADIAAVTLTDAAGNAIPVQIGPAKPGAGKGRK